LHASTMAFAPPRQPAGGSAMDSPETPVAPKPEINDVDGVKFDLEEGWVHLRKSNTEPIIRIYAEAASHEAAQELADRFANALTGHLQSAPANS
ncbi:MAG: hypothetical protein ACPH97_07460, partial [Flavobacteriales bacterium]